MTLGMACAHMTSLSNAHTEWPALNARFTYQNRLRRLSIWKVARTYLN